MKKQLIKLCGFMLMAIFTQNSFARLNLFSCEPEWAALAKALGGEHLHIVSATTAQQDPHHIQARPSLIAKIRRADILICTGAELEIGWLPLLLRKSANRKIQSGALGYFMATDQVNLLGKPVIVDRSMGDVHAAGNPHIQFDPYRMATVAKALNTRLAKIDPKNKQSYQQHYDDFIDHWQKSIKKWEKLAQPLRGKAFIAHHKGWTYLIHWLGLNQIAVLEPKPSVPATSTHLAEVLEKTKMHPPAFILYASYQSDKAANWLAKKTAKPAISLSFSVPKNKTLEAWYSTFIKKLLKAAN